MSWSCATPEGLLFVGVTIPAASCEDTAHTGSEHRNRRRHKVDSRRKAMLSKTSPVELVLRASCNRPIRWRRVDGSFSRGGGDGRMDMRFGAAMPASCEAHERRGPRRAQSGGAAAIPRADIGRRGHEEPRGKMATIAQTEWAPWLRLSYLARVHMSLRCFVKVPASLAGRVPRTAGKKLTQSFFFGRGRSSALR